MKTGGEEEVEGEKEQRRERQWKRGIILLIKVNSTGKFVYKLYIFLNYFIWGGSGKWLVNLGREVGICVLMGCRTCT